MKQFWIITIHIIANVIVQDTILVFLLFGMYFEAKTMMMLALPFVLICSDFCICRKIQRNMQFLKKRVWLHFVDTPLMIMPTILWIYVSISTISNYMTEGYTIQIREFVILSSICIIQIILITSRIMLYRATKR